MNCIDCPYLNSEKIKGLGTIHVCNAHILEDVKGHLMMSAYAKHDWCPMLNETVRKELENE